MKTPALAVALTAIIALNIYSSASFAQSGTDHGNGTDHSELVYPGARKGAPVDPELLPPPQKLPNRMSAKGNIAFGPSGQSVAVFALNGYGVHSLLGQYMFDKSHLRELYKDARDLRGNFTDLNDPRNPFTKERGSYQTDSYSDLKYELKKLNAPSTQIEAAIRDLSISFEVQMNPELVSGGCGACTTEDYARLPGNGIHLKVFCSIGDSPVYEVPGSDVTITSQTQTVRKTLQIVPARLLSTLTDWTRKKICSSPTAATVDVDVQCMLLPVSPGDQQSMEQKFGYFYNTTAISSDTIHFINTAKSNDVRQLTIDSLHTYTHVVEFENPYEYDFRAPVLYGPIATYRSDLAEMIRRSFVASVEKLKATKK